MEIYKIPIEFAFIVFPFIAFILTIPFLIHQYRKYGAIPFVKSACFYSLILYLICAYFLVILPLPSIESVSKMNGPTAQLTLFRFIKDIAITTKENVQGLSVIISFFKQPTVYTIIFNILLTLPYGVYLRYFFKQKWYQVLIYTLLLSLFFEITQLSGLYGIYPRPYRLFDVDDLLINTIGGLLGYAITPMLTIFLPTRDELENKSYKKGMKVTLLRRFMGLIIDIFILTILCPITKIVLYDTMFSDYSVITTLSIYYVIIPLFTSGKTIGKSVVNLKLAGLDRKIKKNQIFLRNFMLVYIIIYPFAWINILSKSVPAEIINRLWMVIFFCQIINIISYIIKTPQQERLFLYERMTSSKNVSTIKTPEEFPKAEKENECSGEKLSLKAMHDDKEPKNYTTKKKVTKQKSENCKKK